jgi:hypothetical protein
MLRKKFLHFSTIVINITFHVEICCNLRIFTKQGGAR